MSFEQTRLRLGDVCTKIGSGATPRGGSDVYRGEGTALIRSQNVYNDGFRRDGLVFVDAAAAAKLAGVTVREHDVLLNITGDSVARACVVPADVLPARVNQHVAIIRPDRELLDPQYLHYWLVSPHVQRHLLTLAGAGATRNALTKGMLEQLVVDAPAVRLQRMIAHRLRTLDDKIDSNRRLGRLAEGAVAHCCTRVAVVGPPPAPGWQTVPFLEVVELNPRVRIAKGTDTPFIAMADVPAFGTRPETIGRRPYSGGCKYEPGDTLMARITGCIEHGKGAFIDFVDEPGAGSTEFLVFRARDPLTPEVVFCLSRDQRLRSHAIASMTGTSGRQRVANSCFEALTVSIAPDSEERAAAMAFMRRAMEISKAAWAEARTLSSIRDALLPKLVSGQIRIPADLDEAGATEPEPTVLVESPA